MKLAKKWNDSGSKNKGTEHRHREEAVYAVKRARGAGGARWGGGAKN